MPPGLGCHLSRRPRPRELANSNVRVVSTRICLRYRPAAGRSRTVRQAGACGSSRVELPWREAPTLSSRERSVRAAYGVLLLPFGVSDEATAACSLCETAAVLLFFVAGTAFGLAGVVDAFPDLVAAAFTRGDVGFVGTLVALGVDAWLRATFAGWDVCFAARFRLINCRV